MSLIYTMADVDFDNPTYDPEGDFDEDTPLIQRGDPAPWEVQNSSPPWAQADIPASISSIDDLATPEQIESLKDQWRREQGVIGGNLELPPERG